VFNSVGNSLSETASYVLASIPPAPSSAPADDTLVTSSQLIKVDYNVISTSEETGGSPILSYNLQMDDSAGHFSDIHGYQVDTLTLSATVQDNIQTGLTYAFRYRVKNLYGWSQFSPVVHILAASVPEAPAKP